MKGNNHLYLFFLLKILCNLIIFPSSCYIKIGLLFLAFNFYMKDSTFNRLPNAVFAN